VAAESITTDQIPPGEVLTYYGDLASGAIRPEDVKIEALTFEVTIGPNGQILSTVPAIGSVQVISRYNFVIEKVRASVMNPDLAGAAPSLVRFNMREQGRSFDVFKQPVDIASLIESPAESLEWRGVYICVPGTQFEVEWFVNTSLWPVLVGAPRTFKITVSGSYIACEPPQQ
jgi:hypothetical protein